MSVLDEIRSNLERARTCLDQARGQVLAASPEAAELETSANGHGWTTVAHAMSSAREALDAASEQLGTAHDATAEACRELSDVDDETGSDAVARRLNAISRQLRSADEAAAQAAGSVADARLSAEQTDAVSLSGLLDDVGDDVRHSREALTPVMAAVEAEATAAQQFGRSAAAADAGGRTGDAAGTGAVRRPAHLNPSTPFTRRAERLTAQRLADNPAFDGRVFSAPAPPDPGYDWVDDLGRTYDAMGDGTRAEYFRLRQFTASIDHNLNKSNDFTVIDLTGYAREQAAAVDQYVRGLPEAKQRKIVRVGF